MKVASATWRDAARAPRSQALPGRDASFWPAAAILVLLCLQATMVFTRAINWDEYSYWREVAYFADGRLDRPLQTLHVRLFSWLAGTFDTSVDHIVAARVAMLGFECVTLIFLYLMARKFADQAVALIVPLAYISAGNVLQHGFSFRVDPMATAGLCGALYFLLCSRLDWRGALGFGLCAAFAAMITIKVVLYFPAFAGVSAYRLLSSTDRARTALRVTFAVVLAALLFGLLLWLHGLGVTAAEGAMGRTSKQFDSSSNWVFFFGLPPYRAMILKAFLAAPALSMMIAATPFLLARSQMGTAMKLVFWGLWLTIACLFFYKNTAAYFFVFLFAPLTLAALPVIQWASRRFSVQLLALAFTSIAFGQFLVEDRSTIDRQRQLERNVHEIFPQPVTYIDQNYMLGGWPKANGFMTAWSMNKYMDAGVPEYRIALEKQTVPLLLVNWWFLDEIMERKDDRYLLPEDNAALRDNYIPFSWPIWVAGKAFPAASAEVSEEFLVPGPYTVEGGPLLLDGTAHADGDVVEVGRGMHRVEPKAPTRLVWGDHLPLPAQPLEPGPLYVGF